MLRNSLFFLLFIGLSACSSKNNEYKAYLENPDLYAATVHELNTVVMGNNFPPMVASRNYAYAAVAAYEVVAAFQPNEYQSLAGQLNELKPIKNYAIEAKANMALTALLAYMKVGEAVTFPEGSLQLYRDSIIEIAKEKGLSNSELAASVKIADSIGNAIIRWSKSDHYAETRSAEKYTVIDTPGRWIPTPPMYASATEPHWNKIRPMALLAANQFMPPKPIPFDIKNTKSEYYQQVIAVKNAVDSLTPEQKHIAEFWDDNPFKLNVVGHVMFGNKKFSPGGHWMSVVGIAAKKANANFSTTVMAYAQTAIALFDAFIQCWDVKYQYNTVRPETVINKYFDVNWRPYLQTPAFPEYTCGHSTISASAAEALTNVFGDNFSYTDTTELEFGIKSRSFTSFRHAALENNLARFYGGIHFHPSCLVSTNQGKLIGEWVVKKLVMKK